MRQRRGRTRRATPARHPPHGWTWRKARRASRRGYPLHLLDQCAAPPIEASAAEQAQHSTTSARQVTYATVRRSGAALMALPAVGLLQHVPRSPGPASFRTGLHSQRYVRNRKPAMNFRKKSLCMKCLG
jgi:hypothetical protein